MTQITIQSPKGKIIKTLDVNPAKPLLSQLESAGVELPNACRTGMCAACMCRVIEGQEHIVQNLRGEPAFPLADEELMTCIGGVKDTQDTIILETLS